MPITHAWRGHGTALFLEFGELRKSARERHPKGDAGVMIEWSWRVERRRSIEVGSWSTDRRIDAGINRLIGPTVVAVNLVGRLPEITVALSDGRWVSSFMTAEGQPRWTIFLREGGWITVHEGRVVHGGNRA
jgi:hypothetical protein